MPNLQQTPMDDKPDDPREQPVTPRAARVVPLNLITRKVIPARHDDPIQALHCSEVIARAADKWGWPSVARSLKCYLEGQELHVDGVTLDELSEGVELLSTAKVQQMTDSIMSRIRQCIDDDAEGAERQ